MTSPRATAETLNGLSRVILDSVITVHKELGPGLLESVYQYCTIDELQNRGISVSAMVPVSLCYKGRPLKKDFVIDILVEDEIILELKSIETLLPIHHAQILTYLKLANKRLGFLVNFNVPRVTDGFRRFVNKL